MNNGIVYVNVGERDNTILENSLKTVRYFQPEIPITIYSDIPLKNFEGLENIDMKYFERVKYTDCGDREENRNSSLFRLKALKESKYENTLYLDNDIFITHKGFFEGFKIAENFGITMVENPRYFIKTFLPIPICVQYNLGDLDIGADVTDYDREVTKDMPRFMMALNMGVMFYNKKSEKFLDELIWEQENNPSRGQAGLYRTIWKTKTTPYALPISWLVCRKHVGIEHPLALHVGHSEVMDWWVKIQGEIYT